MLFYIVKLIILIVIAVVVRGTLPRYRIDQLISLYWKIALFLTIAFFLCFLALFTFLT